MTQGLTVSDERSATSIPALFRQTAARRAGSEALVDGSLRLTWSELRQAVDDAARAFIAVGIRPGDRVAVWAPNTWQWPVALLGLQSAGGVVVPLNTRFKGDEAAYILRRSGARLLLTVDGFLGNDYVSMLTQAAGPPADDRPLAGLDQLEAIVLLSGEPRPATLSWQGLLSRGGGVLAAEIDRRVAALAPEDPSDLMFTSGTTGRPKGVLATHGQVLRIVDAFAERVGLRAGDRYLVVNPFFHTFGYKAGLVCCLAVGATILPFATFDVPALMSLVDRERVTVLPGTPTIYQTMLHADRTDVDLTSLRLATTGGAAVPVELVRRMRDELGFSTVVTAYGLTECNGFVSSCDSGDDPETIATTCGRPFPGLEVRLVDAKGLGVAVGEPGEILVRGYVVMSGYVDEPHDAAGPLEPDGWLHTGDIGVMDERGYLRITDRVKDMFVVGGFNAYPAEIEDVLSRHPAVAQVAVVGVPDERLGEVGAAFVVRRRGADLTEQGVIAWARGRMANFKAPRHVYVLDALPLNASGKVLKPELRRLALERLTGGG